MKYNQKNQEYSERMLAIDKVMLSSLKGKDLSEYMIFRAKTGKELHEKTITPRKAYQSIVIYSENHLKLREDNITRGIECLLSDAEETICRRAGLRIVTGKQLVAATHSAD